MRAPELEPNSGWVNTDRPLSLHGGGVGNGLRGRVVLLEFWSPGRGECDLVLPELAWFAEKYAGQPVEIVGVCSVESEQEEAVERVTNDVHRRRVTHPVVIDRGFRIWRAYGVKEWPTFALVDPAGEVVGKVAGLGNRMLVDRYISRLLADHRLAGTLGEPGAAAGSEHDTGAAGLRYPEGVAAVPPSVGEPGWVCVADTGHDRVVVADWPDDSGRAAVRRVFGGGGNGFAVGDAGSARFCEPGAVVRVPGTGRVMVADRRNHAVRVIDTQSGTVGTIAGTGSAGSAEQGGGASGVNQPLRLPWGLALDEKRQRVLVAMAGDNRVWSIDLTTMVTRAIAGSGRAATVDGRFDEAGFRQPVGVAMSSDGKKAYVLESVGCAVRELDLETERVRTVAGRPAKSGEDPGVLADAGDADGVSPESRLRHPSGLAMWATTPMHAGGDRLLVADTRNGLLRLVDPHEARTDRWPAGGAASLMGPTGIAVAGGRLGGGAASVLVCETEAHRVMRIDAETGERTPIEFDGL